jgi:hypothetical protein
MSAHDARLRDDQVLLLRDHAQHKAKACTGDDAQLWLCIAAVCDELQQRRAAGEPVEGRPTREQVAALAQQEDGESPYSFGRAQAYRSVLALFAPAAPTPSPATSAPTVEQIKALKPTRQKDYEPQTERPCYRDGYGDAIDAVLALYADTRQPQTEPTCKCGIPRSAHAENGCSLFELEEPAPRDGEQET